MPESYDRLDALIDDQSYRLAFWRVAAEEINYRRFFDITQLAAVRMEDPVVFLDTHRLLLRLVGEGKIQGLRIDHPDGLRDPAGYLRTLQESCLDALHGPPDARPQQASARSAGRDTRELGLRVGHVERLVVEHVVEHRSRIGVVREHLPVDGEALRRRLLREMEEREQRLVALAVHPEIVESALARRQPVRLETGRGPRQTSQERSAALPEQRRVPQFVLGVAQVESA